MTNYYVDSNTGDNGDSGLTQALAWATLEYAIESGGISAGDIIWVRRTHSEIPTSDIDPPSKGDEDAPKQVIGWPRPAIPNTTITQADFTNGSTIIDNVVGVTPTREYHVGRYITAPDGERYMIVAILHEADVDGMGSGDEFTVGQYAINTTQTKQGKIYAFTDNEDTTGTIQYVRASDSAWVENDNITDDAGGDAEIDSSGETAVGFVIEREYAGSTVTGTSGKFQIEADEDIDNKPSDVDGWDSDVHSLPVIDFNGGSYSINPYYGDYYWVFKNLDLRDSSFTYGAYYVSGGSQAAIGLLVRTSENACAMGLLNCGGHFQRIVVEGAGPTNTNNVGITTTTATILLEDVAVMNCGGTGIRNYGGSIVILRNVNSGVELQNQQSDLEMPSPTAGGGSQFICTDVSLGGSNGYWEITANSPANFHIGFENFNKTLGVHLRIWPGGQMWKAHYSAETPNKKVSDWIIKLSSFTSGFQYLPTFENWGFEVFCHEFDVTTGSKTYKYWIYNDTGVELNDSAAAFGAKQDIWLQAEYVLAYDDGSEYVIGKAFSSETDIADAADADDWDYLQISGINPAVACRLRIRCFCRHYSATGKIYIDPSPSVS